MTLPKSSCSSSRASPRVTCYGTAFLSDSPVDAAALKRGIAADAPQFASPGLDVSFLANCGSLLNGKTAPLDDPRTYFKRLAGTDFRLPKATHFYECSTELRDLLAALAPERAAEIATYWYTTHRPSRTKLPEPNGRMRRRLAILKNLAALAKGAMDSNKSLILRVEYRTQR
jgi:hypothetical protein